ncbi:MULTISPECIES: hypothetical protein [unclassified Streptomyces]|uniref:hypothetical protein n=1 Tax=unclassified Streptomyces TaxID=2593676 RepID=UPI00278C0622|nr:MULTISPECIES: hypothetical protein [unclassified Streptomyces]
MNDRKFIEEVRARPGMYGLNGTYHPTAMLLLGHDLARSGGTLRGFREWLIVRKGEPSSFAWYALVLQEALPGADIEHWRQLSPDQDRHAVDQLFSLVLDFLEARDDSLALAHTYAEYHRLCALKDGESTTENS